MPEIDSFSQIKLRDAHIKAQKRFTLIALTVIGTIAVLSVVINILLLAAFNSYPKTKFLWTTDTTAVCVAHELDEPTLSNPLLVDFAQRAAISVYQFNYLNWQEELTIATQKYFTRTAATNYINELATSNVLSQIQTSYYIVQAISDGIPFISKHGIKNGVYFWTVEVPMIIKYTQADKYKIENRVIIMTIVRVDPTPDNPNGVAVDGVVTTQRAK